MQQRMLEIPKMLEEKPLLPKEQGGMREIRAAPAAV
jgi:hypothetical protein